jgi:hypothetical protein
MLKRKRNSGSIRAVEFCEGPGRACSSGTSIEAVRDQAILQRARAGWRSV